MQIQIVSKGIDVSPAIRERISGRIEEMMDKYIHRDGQAHVALSREGSGFRVLASVHLPSGATLEGKGEAQDAYAASDEAMTHLEKRLRRYKRRLKDHNAAAKSRSFSMFILENPVTDNDAEDDDKDLPADPIVIAEAPGQIKTMTPSMAALELGLADNGVVVFHNARHGGINVVFKRSDGHIGWVDPQ